MNNRVKKILNNPAALFLTLGYRGCFNWMSDEKYLKIAYRCKVHKKLNLDNPKTFTEKLQWLKIHDRKPEYTDMVDKLGAKKFIISNVGKEYAVPTLGVWERYEDICFQNLPDKFVLKCTHDSGSFAICTEKKSFDYKKAKRILSKGLKHNSYWAAREWPYKNVKPQIIAEPYLEDSQTGELRDYKFFMFNGVPRVFYITSGRKKGDRRTDFFDMELNHLDIQDDDKNAEIPPAIPENFDKMIEIAKQISKNIPQLRVDFYEVDGKVYVGEMTFYYLGGFVPFKPEKWDEIFGNWIDLSIV